MNPKIRRSVLRARAALAVAGLAAAGSAVAHGAPQVTPQGATAASPYAPSPYPPSPYSSYQPQPYAPAPAYPAPAYAPPAYRPPTFAPVPAYPSPARAPYSPPMVGGSLSQADAEGLRLVMAASKQGDPGPIRAAMAGLYDPLARKLALWTLADMGVVNDLEAEAARRDLGDWPRADRRMLAAEQQSLVASADAEFQAGWTALIRQKDARSADQHFARLQTIGQSPLTQSRALYWRGRAAAAMGDPLGAQLFFAQAGRYETTFYGQLAAGKAGAATISLGHDPVLTAAERAAFEAREPIRAARLLAQIGAKDGFKTFVGALSTTLPTVSEEALL
ncbi:MAG: hypothetical protein ACR2FH_11620, partial [Caulobacteraceae bacterium]